MLPPLRENCNRRLVKRAEIFDTMRVGNISPEYVIVLKTREIRCAEPRKRYCKLFKPKKKCSSNLSDNQTNQSMDRVLSFNWVQF